MAFHSHNGGIQLNQQPNFCFLSLLRSLKKVGQPSIIVQTCIVSSIFLATAHLFDYFVHRQSVFGLDIRHTESFTINDNYFLAHTISTTDNRQCTDSLITRWTGTSLEEHQRIRTSGAYKMVFFKAEDGNFFLIILNSDDLCLKQKGKSIQKLLNYYKINKFTIYDILLNKSSWDVKSR